MQSPTIDLVERVRSRLHEVDRPCQIAGPAPDEAIAAVEAELECELPPSYRAFLARFGELRLPSDLAVVHELIGLDPTAPDRGVVARTLAGRAEHGLHGHLIVVGQGAAAHEWFCLDAGRPGRAGEYPVILYDAHEREPDQVFYEDFEAMVREVLEFVEHTLTEPDAASMA